MSIDNALRQIASARAKDPLAPVTVVVPSHIAALQLRRRLAALGPFAAVRFETLPRLAELIAASTLAAQGRRPLARPIGDYLARQLALEARAPLDAVRERPGFAPALRRAFTRLRRGGLDGTGDPGPRVSPVLDEVMRLYRQYRDSTAAFYDEEDLMHAAATVIASTAGSAVRTDLGTVHLAGHIASTAGAASFAAALARHLGAGEWVEDAAAPAISIALSPDAESESARVARDVVVALESGRRLDSVAVLFAGSNGHEAMLRESLARAAVPVYAPGVALARTLAGRAALALLNVVESDFARTAVFDFLHLVAAATQQPVSSWDRISREAGVTRGRDRWHQSLGQLTALQRMQAADPHADERTVTAAQWRADQAAGLDAAITQLASRLDALHRVQPANEFVAAFGDVLSSYVPDGVEGVDEVRGEIEQLGTIAAVGGHFDLGSFRDAIRANLDVARLRMNRLDEGVLVASHQAAAGLEFDEVMIAGAVEDAFPARAPVDPLLPETDMRRMQDRFPMLEDRHARRRSALRDAESAIGSARQRLTLSAFQYESGGRRPKHASHLVVAAARRHDASIASGSTLRAAPATPWLRRDVSPLSAVLSGPPLDVDELRLRDAVAGVGGEALRRPLGLRAARRGSALTEWDGLVGGGVVAPLSVSPTALEKYATCGFRYFGESVLRLTSVDEPEDVESMDVATRGSLVHSVLERFFAEQRTAGRPGLREPWDAADEARVVALLGEELARIQVEGRSGLTVFLERDRQALAAELRRFLVADSAFRMETGAVPGEFESSLPETLVAGIRLRGKVDRIDYSADRSEAWVLDYKTGSDRKYASLRTGTDPLAGGTLLQLAAYARAADAPRVYAAYWFITRRAGFQMLPGTRSEPPHEAFERTVAAILAGVEAGVFPAVPGEEDEFRGSFTNCTYCALDRICPTRRLDAFAEKAADPTLAPWRAVALAARVGGDDA